MALLRTKTATVVLTCSVPLATDWPCGLIMKAVPHATIAANSSNPPMNIRARPILPHICPRCLRIANHRATFALCWASVSRNVPTRAVSDKVECLRGRGMEHGGDARLAGIGDRTQGEVPRGGRCCSRCRC